MQMKEEVVRENQEVKPIIVVHRVQEVAIGDYEGSVMLVNPDTGEILHEQEPQYFSRCHEMYTAYKLFIGSIRQIAKRGYNFIYLDTNCRRFAAEIAQQETSRSLQRQLAERCVICGIKEISIIPCSN
jgi:hypothetical protein